MKAQKNPGVVVRGFANWIELGSACDCYDIHAFAFAVELHFAIRECKQGVILATADVQAGVNFRPTLADDDVSSDDSLATEFLYAKTLAA